MKRDADYFVHMFEGSTPRGSLGIELTPWYVSETDVVINLEDGRSYSDVISETLFRTADPR